MTGVGGNGGERKGFCWWEMKLKPKMKKNEKFCVEKIIQKWWIRRNSKRLKWGYWGDYTTIMQQKYVCNKVIMIMTSWEMFSNGRMVVNLRKEKQIVLGGEKNSNWIQFWIIKIKVYKIIICIWLHILNRIEPISKA